MTNFVSLEKKLSVLAGRSSVEVTAFGFLQSEIRRKGDPAQDGNRTSIRFNKISEAAILSVSEDEWWTICRNGKKLKGKNVAHAIVITAGRQSNPTQMAHRDAYTSLQARWEGFQRQESSTSNHEYRNQEQAMLFIRFALEHEHDRHNHEETAPHQKVHDDSEYILT